MFRLLAVLFLFVLGTAPARAWSQLGHRLIAELAERQLSPAVRTQVRALLRNEPEPGLAEISVWADHLRELPAFGWSVPLHYVHIRDRGCRYDAARDCPDDLCVVGAIQRYARKLGDPALSSEEHTEALKFLVHFVADVHQPLHAGWRLDQGGNRFQTSLDGRGTHLHGVWDYSVLAAVGESYAVHASRLQSGLSSMPRTPFAASDAARWAEASCSLTNSEGFYPRRPGTLPRDYLTRMRPLAEARLRDAALHLAETIETALGEANRRRLR